MEIIDTSFFNYFSSKNAMIVGLVKDASQTLPTMLPDLDELSTYFNLTTFIFFESNSNDNTLQILLDWRDNNNMTNMSKKKQIYILNADEMICNLFGLNLEEISKMSRESKYVFYRNMLLKHAKKAVNTRKKAENTFFIIIDLDVAARISPKNGWNLILNEIYIGQKTKNLNLFCLNGIAQKGYNMRDTFAVIDMNDDWYRGMFYKFNLNKFDIYSFLKHTLYTTYYPLLSHKRWIDVKSCFGGMAFYYSLQQIKETECKYILFSELQQMSNDNMYNMYNSSQIVNNYKIWFKQNETCEHIPFNICLFNHGFNAAISTYSTFIYQNFN